MRWMVSGEGGLHTWVGAPPRVLCIPRRFRVKDRGGQLIQLDNRSPSEILRLATNAWTGGTHVYSSSEIFSLRTGSTNTKQWVGVSCSGHYH